MKGIKQPLNLQHIKAILVANDPLRVPGWGMVQLQRKGHCEINAVSGKGQQQLEWTPMVNLWLKNSINKMRWS